MSKKDFNDIQDRVYSIINLLKLADLALDEMKPELIPTALESAFEKMQELVDDYCVEEE